MQVPVQIAFHGIEKDDDLERLIRDHVNKLDRLHGRIASCRVVVEQPHKSRGPGWEVRIDMRVPPHHELVVRERVRDTQAKEGVGGLVISAFDVAKRRLTTLKERQQGEVKNHAEALAHGVIARIGPEYGFVRTVDDRREVYFHRNSVLNADYDDLQVGAAVAFTEEMGREGPQASTLRVTEAHPMKPT